MNIPQIMAAMSLVKASITREHSILEAYKIEVRAYSQMGLSEDATQSYKDVVNTRSRIKRLVALQAALKKDYYRAISMQRAERLMLNGWLKPHLDEMKARAEEKGKAARYTGMSMAGEMY